MVKAALFDYDGVVTKGAENERIFGTLATNLGVTLAQTTEWLMEVWRPYLKGHLTEADVWAHVEKKYGRPIAKEKRNIWFTWEELTPLAEMLQLIAELKEKGIVVGVLSNAFKETVELIDDNGGYNSFDLKVLSCYVGYAKPDEEIFQIALSKLEGTSPAEVVFLDDREKNAIAAGELGMSGIYVTDHADAISEVRLLAGI